MLKQKQTEADHFRPKSCSLILFEKKMCMAPNILYNTDMFVVTDAKAITQF